MILSFMENFEFVINNASFKAEAFSYHKKVAKRRRTRIGNIMLPVEQKSLVEIGLSTSCYSFC